MTIKPSDVLKLAKNHLKQPEPSKKLDWETYFYVSPYICDAIDHAGLMMDSNKAVRIADKIRAKISKSINGYFSVQQWLEYEKGIHHSELTVKNMQAYRHRWLDALIDEYERASK